MLDQEVKEKAKEIFTDSYTMSIGEIASMYSEDELELQPEYQRFFRWSNSQKTKFIESILLGIPIPPIFVYQRKDGVWTVIDGLQRLSTIFQFMEILNIDSTSRHEVPALELHGTKFLPSLEGKKWENGDNAISKEIKLFFKRSRLDVKIIKYTSDVDSQYELFQRLNTGGSSLSEQEIRNSLMIMGNREFYAWFEELNNNINFQNCLPLSKKQTNEKDDMDYLLRYFIFTSLKITDITGKEDMSPYITEKMHELIKIDNFNYDEKKIVFEQVFSILSDTLGEDSFKKFDPDKSKFTGAVSMAFFEAIVPGLTNSIIEKPYEPSQNERKEKLKKLIENLSNTEEFLEKKNQSRPISRTKELVTYSEEYFSGL
ncbi:Protein of unknown function DUF262 [Desemzia incerta]|uniref:GmrSD restriction endonucleases N-terminal domain-containing protein n=1 Tax=Desemzia incerta TaxID=82801 RepID=A0A1I5UV53_9LACT|nr:DUF262 domain-containing protein [Desemzia incerta]SFP99068.1 Protein of unknown function DUF262 [Desemzia incerta]